MEQNGHGDWEEQSQETRAVEAWKGNEVHRGGKKLTR